jgi:hypothetical protein
VRAVVGVEAVEQPRRARHDLARARVVGVERPQRVEVDALAHLAAQAALVRAQVGLQLLAVGGAGRRRAEAGDPQAGAGHAELGEQRRQQQHALGVDRGLVGADRLGADLPELAEAAGLRALATEERAQVPELHRLGELVHAVLEVRAADRRGALRAQRDLLLGEGVHLLLDDVGRRADAAGEQVGLLEQRRLDPRVAGGLEDLASLALERRARGRVVGQHVVRAARGLDLLHPRASSSRKGLVARSRPSVVTPMWPGKTFVSSG